MYIKSYKLRDKNYKNNKNSLRSAYPIYTQL